MTTTVNPDPLPTAADTAWLEYVKGTWSESDQRLFVDGFQSGWRESKERIRRRLPQSYTTVRVSCWLCRGEHEMGVKFCPVLVRAIL